jgi:UrcA family protein
MLKILPALGALAVAAALVVPTVSHAQELATATVSYADLNLASRVGQNVLRQRINFAAASLCDIADPRDLKFARAVGECRSDAIASAEPAFSAAVRNSYHPTVTIGAATLIVSAPLAG